MTKTARNKVINWMRVNAPEGRRKLALKAKISQSTITRVLQGHDIMCRRAARLADAVGTTLNEIAGVK